MKKVQSHFVELKNKFVENKQRCFTYAMLILFGGLIGIQQGYFLLPVLVFVVVAFSLHKEDLSLNETPALNLCIGIVLAFLFMGLAQFTLAKMNHFFIALPSSFGAIECIFYGLVFAVCEELFFRGLILKKASIGFNQTTALILSAILYGIYARSSIGVVIGLGLGVITQKADSVYPAVFANFLFRVMLIYEAFNLDQFANVLHMFDQSGFVYDWGNGLILLGLALWCIGLSLKGKNNQVQEKNDL